jgi:preflagellin peptidase FlaK
VGVLPAIGVGDPVSVGPVTVFAVTDLVRLVAVPAFAWAAWRDLQTRRVPRAVWPPLLAVGVALLAIDAWAAWGAPFRWRPLALRSAVSLGVVAPMGYVVYRLGGFGLADLKAVAALAVLFPTYPAFAVRYGPAVPLVETDVGVFSLTVLTNAVVIGLAYPAALAVRNAAAGRFTPVMFVGKRVPWDDLAETHGRLLETPAGTTRRGLDLDALRMYLRWRGASLGDVRASPALRDPDTLPATPNAPTDGAVAARPTETGPETESGPADGAGRGPAAPDAPELEDDGGGGAGTGDGPGSDTTGESGTDVLGPAPIDDPWGAEAFLADVGSAYGTTPADLRDGLDLLVYRDAVWVSPGIPFVGPLFLGLVVGLTYGDLLFGLLRFVGVV